MKKGPRLHWLVAACLLSAVSACGTPTQSIKDRDSWERVLSSENTSVVYGRIQWLENGKEKTIGKGLFDFSISPTLLRMEDRSKAFGDVAENGLFVWALEPGTYVINRINYRDPWSGNYFMVPKVGFRIPDKGKVYYIGTLRADFASKRDLIGGLSGRVNVTIEDQRERDDVAIAEDLKIMPKDVERSLMVHDERLPVSIDTTEEFNKAVQILNAILFGLSH